MKNPKLTDPTKASDVDGMDTSLATKWPESCTNFQAKSTVFSILPTVALTKEWVK